MKNIFSISFLTLSTLVVLASSVAAREDDPTQMKPESNAQKTTVRTYDELYKMVCKGRDPDQLCNKVDTEVNRSIADTLTAMRPVIHAAAKTYGIDPATIVGSLLAEHSMNTGATDIAQDALVKLGLAKNGTLDFGFYKKTFTFGFGQLHFERALEAEKIAAQIEQRPLRTQEQVRNALMTPEGSAYYAAALVRQARDLYLGAGYDLSDDTATLTTLYNIGKINERLERTKKEGRPPQPNYFGLFVLKNKDRIAQIVGDYNPNAGISLAQQKSQAPADSPYVTRYRASESLMPLKSGMASIGLNSAAFATGNFVLKPGDQFELVGSIEDASLGTLHLVKNNEGKMGYLPEAVIAKKAKSILVNKSACAIDGSKKCLEDMENHLSEKDGETYAHLQEVAAPKKKPLSPREEILLKAQMQAEEMVAAFANQAFKKNQSGRKEASERIDNYLKQLAPVFDDYAKVAESKIEALLKKKEKLENAPKLEESDIVEILEGIREFRAKAARTQPDGTGVLGSAYGVFEPLLEFYEACAVEHHGESAKVKEFFSGDTYATNFYGQRNFSANEALGYIKRSNQQGYSEGNTFENWVANKLRYVRYGEKVPLVDSQEKGREGEKVRKNSGKNCYGSKADFLDWLKSIPVKANPSWQDLEPTYAKAAEFYNPVVNQEDLDFKVQQVPAEINKVKANLTQNLEVIAKHYPSLKERLLKLKKGLETDDPLAQAKEHPAVQLLQTVRDQFRDCRLVTHKDKELTAKLEALDAELGGDIQRLIQHYGNGYGGSSRVMEYEMQDALSHIFRELFPNETRGSQNSVMNIFQDTVPVNNTMNSDVASFLSRWATLGKVLQSSCGIFEDPLLDAYLNQPELLPAGAETCVVDIVNKNSINRNATDIKKIQMSLLDVKQKFGDEKERFRFVADSLKMLGWNDNGRAGGGETAMKKARFPTYHDLAKELSEKDCVKAIFVSRVQELDLPKTVFMPSGNDSSIRVIWKGNKCN